MESTLISRLLPKFKSMSIAHFYSSVISSATREQALSKLRGFSSKARKMLSSAYRWRLEKALGLSVRHVSNASKVSTLLQILSADKDKSKLRQTQQTSRSMQNERRLLGRRYPEKNRTFIPSAGEWIVDPQPNVSGELLLPLVSIASDEW